MKKLYFLLSAITALSATTQAQDTSSYSYRHNKHRYDDSYSSRWAFEANLMGGLFTQDMKVENSSANYYNSLNLNTGNLKFKHGGTAGFDGEVNYFVGHDRHFGLGSGIMYLGQWGDAILDNYHVEYQAVDGHGNTFRQLVTGNQVREAVKISNFSIPVLLKYKTRFSERAGFSADAGILVNLHMENSYTTHASFDYEGIYKFVHNADGSVTTVYDNSPTPASNDWLITKAQYLKNNGDGNVQSYFDGLRSQGYNVGLGVKPASTKGSVSYNEATIGYMIRPSFNYYLSDLASLDLGVYYIYQPMTNTAEKNYRLTNTSGEYSSVLNSVTETKNQSYGITAGLRFFIGKPKDSDHDGIPDKKDKCPYVFGVPQFMGCPDTDGDGIPDDQDSCITIQGLVQFHGCPDSDGDGIPDKDDACPHQAGLALFHGCPDTDGDGIPDKDDLCPTRAGLVQFHGCPDTDGDGVPDNEDRCPDVAGPVANGGCPYEAPKPVPQTEISVPLATPILFNLNKATVHESSMPVLREAVKELNADAQSYIVIDGYCDITGSVHYNDILSQQRANAVKHDLVEMGADPSRLKAVGHGKRHPAATNKTKEGRAQNRRAVMKIKDGK